MSPSLAKHLDALTGFPRVSGDEPRCETTLRRLFSFSPRERG